VIYSLALYLAPTRLGRLGLWPKKNDSSEGKSMSSLLDRFAQAQKDVNDIAERPDNDTMLRLYALYKQATLGDAAGERPSSFDFVRLAKFDAWSKMKGTSTEDATQQYIDLVASLRG
jgi:diazepam-binding inhibitor (GABA receptor modulating acyl-CoA-binding protein)